MEVIIERFDTLAGSPAIPIAVEGWTVLIDQELIPDNSCLLQWNNKALVARTEEGTIVGVLVYTDMEWEQKLGVVLGYIQPIYRFRGIYRKLWSALVERAQELGRLRIEGATHVNNSTMQEVMLKLGRTPCRIEYLFDVPKKG